MPNKSTPNARNSAAVSDSVPLLTVHKLLGKCLQRARYPCAVAIAVITISTVIAQQQAMTPTAQLLPPRSQDHRQPRLQSKLHRRFRKSIRSEICPLLERRRGRSFRSTSSRTAVLNTRQAEHAITHNNSRLTPADGAAINALLTTQEQTIDSLSTQILQGTVLPRQLDFWRQRMYPYRS